MRSISGTLLQVGLEQLGAAALFGRAARLFFGAAVVDRDARAFLRQAQRDAAADALGRARDQHDFPASAYDV